MPLHIRAPLRLPALAPPSSPAPSPARSTPGDVAPHIAAPRAPAPLPSAAATARLLADNGEAWRARWALLAGARSHIDSAYFSVTRDCFGAAFLGHLLKKQRDGVQVRLVMDAMADNVGRHYKVLGRDALHELVGAGAEVRYYHPVLPRVLELGARGAASSNHDKALVADGRRGITGGRNIGADYFAAPADMPTAWRDTDVQIDGAPARALAAAVALDCADEQLAPAVEAGVWGGLQRRDGELLGAYTLMDLWLNDAPAAHDGPSTTQTDAARTEDLLRRAVARLPAEGVTRALDWYELTNLHEIAAELVTHRALRGSARAPPSFKPQAVRAQVLDRTASASSSPKDDFIRELTAAAGAAQKTLLLQNPYVVLTEQMIEVLEAASRRGVAITIVTNSPTSTDSALTQAFFLEDWPHILARLPTARIFVFTGERKLHAKVAVADDDVSLVSSYNLDLLSSAVNGEIGALMRSRAMAADVARSIHDDLADPANRVVELSIEKNDDGSAVLVNGAPVAVVGPDDHLTPAARRRYGRLRAVVEHARHSFDFLAALRHPALHP